MSEWKQAIITPRVIEYRETTTEERKRTRADGHEASFVVRDSYGCELLSEEAFEGRVTDIHPLADQVIGKRGVWDVLREISEMIKDPNSESVFIVPQARTMFDGISLEDLHGMINDMESQFSADEVRYIRTKVRNLVFIPLAAQIAGSFNRLFGDRFSAWN